MSDEPAQTVTQRPILHLPMKAKLNGTGVVKKPDGEVRREEIMAEQGVPPAPAKEE